MIWDVVFVSKLVVAESKPLHGSGICELRNVRPREVSLRELVEQGASGAQMQQFEGKLSGRHMNKGITETVPGYPLQMNLP